MQYVGGFQMVVIVLDIFSLTRYFHFAPHNKVKDQFTQDRLFHTDFNSCLPYQLFVRACLVKTKDQRPAGGLALQRADLWQSSDDNVD